MNRNKKGVSDVGIGAIISVAIVLIVGVILLQASAQQIGDVVNTYEIANQSLTTNLGAASDGATVYVENCRALVGTVIVFNASGNVPVPADNWTLHNNQIHPTSGALTVNITTTALSDDNYGVWTVDGTCQPTTYETSSGGRAIMSIVIIFFALALAVVALYPVLQNRGLLGA